MNTLYFGDNLEILRDKIPSDHVHLIYLDPPFKSGKDYNIIFRPETNKIKGATAQVKTFEDTWQWGDEAEREYDGLITGSITKERPDQKLIELLKAMRGYLGECPMMAYLCMMAPRLLEMKRVLKDTGSIYLHCDPAASHYLKVLMDAVFGDENFRTEIAWKRTSSHSDAKRYGPVHDVLLYYSRGDKPIWNRVYQPYEESYIEQYYRFTDPDGRRWMSDNLTATGLKGGGYGYEWKGVKRLWRCPKSTMERLDREGRIYYTRNKIPRLKRYLDESQGLLIQDVWTDIQALRSWHKERLGYPTQKPEALLERIVKASSNEGDILLDPFCGCGTAIAVAERLNRAWIGIDITYLAIDVIKKRLARSGIKEGTKFAVEGEPTDLYSAEKLAQMDSFQFQLWCISRLDATPSQTRSGDEGVDGILNFIDLAKKHKAGKGVISVKGTKSVNPGMVRELKGTMKSQEADFGILITLCEPTKGMVKEAVKEGFFTCARKKIPSIQLLSVPKLFEKPIPVILPGYILPPHKSPVIIKQEQKKLFEKKGN